jgi:hypothetical protein
MFYAMDVSEGLRMLLAVFLLFALVVSSILGGYLYGEHGLIDDNEYKRYRNMICRLLALSVLISSLILFLPSRNTMEHWVQKHSEEVLECPIEVRSPE